MRAAVLQGPGQMIIDEVPDVPARTPPGWVRVRVGAVGLCGSDIHYYEYGAIGNHVVRAPLILGHEVGGVVEATGEGVAIPVGAVVAIEPGVPCGTCAACRAGAYNLCPAVRFLATPPVNGALCDIVVHPAPFTFVAAGLTVVEACLAEPMAVGVYATRLGRVMSGTQVLVVGGGPIGVLVAVAAAHQGGEVLVAEVNPDRRNAARLVGVTAVVPGAVPRAAYEVVVECSGTAAGLSLAHEAVQSGGTLVLVGMGKRDAMHVDGLDVASRGLTIRGVFRYTHAFPAALALIRHHRDRLRHFVGQQIRLEDLPPTLASRAYTRGLKTIVMVS